MDYSPELEIDKGPLSAFILDTVSEVDPSVSPFLGDFYLIRFDDTKGRPVMGSTAEAPKKYKETVQRKREMMRLCGESGRP